MIFNKENSFVKQIIIYLNNRDFEKACELSREFSQAFPASLMSHYLLAKSCYWRHDFINALMEGHKSLNMSESREDMVASAVFLSCVYFELKRFTRGYEVLMMVRHLEDERIERALAVLAMCRNEPETALMHIDELYRINKAVAERFTQRMLDSGLPQ